METVHVIKIGGKVLDDEGLMDFVIQKIAASNEKFILIHGGGSLCDKLLSKLGIEVKMIEGRRVTNKETLDVCTMVYAGLLNKKLIQKLQQKNLNAIGLCGADAQCVISKKRISDPDFGFVGDLNPENISVSFISLLLNQNIFPVFNSITYNTEYGLLNTNADSVAANIALALKNSFNVKLHFLFDREGVLDLRKKEPVLIEKIKAQNFKQLKREGIIQGGMIPKMENAIECVKSGVAQVYLSHPSKFTLDKNLFYGTCIEN